MLPARLCQSLTSYLVGLGSVTVCDSGEDIDYISQLSGTKSTVVIPTQQRPVILCFTLSLRKLPGSLNELLCDT